ncbi:hypothetical protein [Nocardia carnea]|uniref:hypothetical protein n=1 Tax=Nocardia carnea TaxID=37328 RepID=UPI0024547131|nr:hypothetical protein [Nocardia carnea]
MRPGAPAYCTDLTKDELPAALAAAERDKLPNRRQLAEAVFADRFGHEASPDDPEFATRVGRLLFM